MSKLRNRDALRREAQSDRKAKEARAVLESRIEEAMDRWQGQIEKAPWLETENDRQDSMAIQAGTVYRTYGAVFV